MPAECALKMIRSMYESNKTLSIGIEARYESQKSITCCSWEVTHFDNNAAYIRSSAPSGIDQILPYDNGVITIVWINQITPTYSIGDKVLILSTEEIGEVVWYVHSSEFMTIKTINWYPDYHWSQLAKLPHDLFPNN